VLEDNIALSVSDGNVQCLSRIFVNIINTMLLARQKAQLWTNCSDDVQQTGQGVPQWYFLPRTFLSQISVTLRNAWSTSITRGTTMLGNELCMKMMGFVA
jgi:hypothetical protein